jgi:hypothetical protein
VSQSHESPPLVPHLFRGHEHAAKISFLLDYSHVD